ncbi:Hypothetical predicted protein [Mytilus galloprovincialis]|uniref:CCHC-type domain-containing protein n=1 Tax=Mytilus galloprovincialis TaxID=29158 RepID=A0A8B6FAH0_MYTGA|nr:Hypothetical predicted protein [Mytilus galloprovincialis]
MADSSEHGWRVVQEYTSNPLADDSEDDKKIMRATSRAERKAKVEKSKKKRSTPYSRPSTSADNGNNSGGAKSARRPGVCYNCYKPGHWQFECPEKNKKLSTHSFSWVIDGVANYFVFNVLPFGIASAGHIFTKVLKEVVKYWRKQGLKIIMYLDDGLGGASDLVSSKRASDYIRKSLSDFGFLIAEDKCIWYPQQNLIWIGLVWDMYLGKFRLLKSEWIGCY